MNQSSIMTKFSQVQTESEFVKEAVRLLVNAGSKDLEFSISAIRKNLALIKEGTMETYDDEILQLQIINLPVEMYYVGQKIEEYTADEEIANYKRKEIYNDIVIRAQRDDEGSKKTVKDKTAEAEFASAEERLVEQIFTIAIRQLKMTLETSKMLYEALKKVLDTRNIRYQRKLEGN